MERERGREIVCGRKTETDRQTKKRKREKNLIKHARKIFESLKIQLHALNKQQKSPGLLVLQAAGKNRTHAVCTLRARGDHRDYQH